MSNRRRAKRIQPELEHFMASVRLLGYDYSLRDFERLADLLMYGFAAPDGTDAQMVQSMVDMGCPGSSEHIAALVDLGRICLLQEAPWRVA